MEILSCATEFVKAILKGFFLGRSQVVLNGVGAGMRTFIPEAAVSAPP
jgi:hypothetical protein